MYGITMYGIKSCKLTRWVPLGVRGVPRTLFPMCITNMLLFQSCISLYFYTRISVLESSFWHISSTIVKQCCPPMSVPESGFWGAHFFVTKNLYSSVSPKLWLCLKGKRRLGALFIYRSCHLGLGKKEQLAIKTAIPGLCPKMREEQKIVRKTQENEL